MFCPKCGSMTKILDTRYNKLDGEAYRHRKCTLPGCDHKFYTVEFIVEATDDFAVTWDKALSMRRRWGKKNE